ncbi:autotransporter domain protein [Campylobacter pinnipediorum subsp. pinnipediorum]|uniref:autotransporter outer membrane beta-barrel domain-containing protein n=1 Tax=Campylobacter pinnipediorum TaxID=1965231 RepID=UPI0009C2B53E|nr:autotransporter domain-containing protein [Campylobacter pinnipediorum]AQW81463.1 autotransporter domain protein [Campylobacter pinnipediorum subsp. pinnipediorum]
MKISKIACCTLLGAIIATGAFADEKQDYLNIKDAKDNIVKEIKAFKDSLSKVTKFYLDRYDSLNKDDVPSLKELHSHITKLVEYFDVINKDKKGVSIPKNGQDTCDKDKTNNCLFAIIQDNGKKGVYLNGKKIAKLDKNKPVIEKDILKKYKEKNKPLDESVYLKLQEFVNKQAKEIADKYTKEALKNDGFKNADKKLLAEAIVTANGLNKNEAQTVSSLFNIKDDKNKLSDIIAEYEDSEEIAMLGKMINKSLEDITSGFNHIDTIDAIISNTGLATNSRLAKLSNPLNDDLALAYAIKNLSDNKFADNGDTLSSVVKEYTNRFNYDSNLWGNIMGGKAKLKSQANTNTYGFMLGYDQAFDNMIIGGYAGYTNAKSSSKMLTTKSDNYHFGAYTRMYIEQNEIDAKVSYGKGKNKLDRKVIDPDFDANGKYDTNFFDASIDYGYIFDINNNSFMKPMIGLEYSHVSTKGFKETGKVPVSFKGTTVKTLSAKAAVEFRKYIANGNFLYITPGIQKELRKSMKDTQLAFVNSTENIKYASKKDKNTFFTLKTGAEMRLTDNLSTNINFGVKAKSESKYYNGTVGLSYKF